jgi:hypothetical protein
LNGHRLLALLAIAASCDDGAPSVIVEISSDLEIPRETNSLVARVQSDGRTIAEETYSLGDAPRDRWPQTLPLISGATYDERVSIAAEARLALTGPSVVVAYGEMEIEFPTSGSETVELALPRSCVDSDRDGFGIGFGCKRPDCDDTDSTIPSPNFCPGFGAPDAGPMDVGPIEAGPDAGPIDAAPDSGVPGPTCGTTTCSADQTCLGDQCWKSCATNEDCGALALGCLEEFGVCICRAPCFNGDQDCGPYECIDGCCDL